MKPVHRNIASILAPMVITAETDGNLHGATVTVFREDNSKNRDAMGTAVITHAVINAYLQLGKNMINSLYGSAIIIMLIIALQHQSHYLSHTS